MERLRTILQWIMKKFILFNIGGMVYYTLEVLWRGYSHWTMYCLAGLCFLIIGELNEGFEYEDPLVYQMVSGALIITFMEFMFGVLLNIILGLHIWDYSDMPFNVLGQICLPFTVLWFFLSLVAIVADDYIRYLLFNEEEPHYIFFGRNDYYDDYYDEDEEYDNYDDIDMVKEEEDTSDE